MEALLWLDKEAPGPANAPATIWFDSTYAHDIITGIAAPAASEELATTAIDIYRRLSALPVIQWCKVKGHSGARVTTMLMPWLTRVKQVNKPDTPLDGYCLSVLRHLVIPCSPTTVGDAVRFTPAPPTPGSSPVTRPTARSQVRRLLPSLVAEAVAGPSNGALRKVSANRPIMPENFATRMKKSVEALRP